MSCGEQHYFSVIEECLFFFNSNIIIKHCLSLRTQEQLCEQRLPATEADSLLDIVVKNCNTIKYDICLAQEFIVTQVNILLLSSSVVFFLHFSPHLAVNISVSVPPSYHYLASLPDSSSTASVLFTALLFLICIFH